MENPRIVFFGTPDLACIVLDHLKEKNLTPSLIVTTPDKPQGRKMLITSSPVKIWADKNSITTLQPENLSDELLLKKLEGYDLFIVFAYGNILPITVINLPKYGTLNLHPSLLPSLRGASPIRSAILSDQKETGVTIMKMDEKMDHGPILAQEKINVTKSSWPPYGKDFDKQMVTLGAQLLTKMIPKWIKGELQETEQPHSQATFCGKIIKTDGEINLNDDPYKNLLKIRAFDEWPGTYFFVEKNNKKLRVKIIDAELLNNSLQILRVVPEGKKEMNYSDFIKNI